MILVIDNYDSFTYNLVQMLGTLGASAQVFRNDKISLADIESLNPSAVVISPGPGTPKYAGISVELVKRFTGIIPILGVCLGHQSIAEAFGANIVRARRIMHGKTSAIEFRDSPLYKGIKSPSPGGRYHSLAVGEDRLPSDLVVDASSEDGEIMGLHHRDYPIYGVQFHPESILTPCGKRLLSNFLKIVEDYSQGKDSYGQETKTRNEKIYPKNN